MFSADPRMWRFRFHLGHSTNGYFSTPFQSLIFISTLRFGNSVCGGKCHRGTEGNRRYKWPNAMCEIAKLFLRLFGKSRLFIWERSVHAILFERHWGIFGGQQCVQAEFWHKSSLAVSLFVSMFCSNFFFRTAHKF